MCIRDSSCTYAFCECHGGMLFWAEFHIEILFIFSLAVFVWCSRWFVLSETEQPPPPLQEKICRIQYGTELSRTRAHVCVCIWEKERARGTLLTVCAVTFIYNLRISGSIYLGILLLPFCTGQYDVQKGKNSWNRVEKKYKNSYTTVALIIVIAALHCYFY